MPGPMSDLATSTSDRDATWAAPVLWRSEFRNIVTGAIRRGELAYDRAMITISNAEAQMAANEHYIQSNRVMSLVLKSTCTAYDCEYVALAQDLGVMLVTTDRQVLREF